MSGGHEDQDSRENILVNDVIPNEVSVSPDTEREYVQNVGEQGCILRCVWEEK